MGPHVRLWHSAGVANTSSTGLRPSTLARSNSCIESGGTRVSIEATGEGGDVGVWTLIAGAPTGGGARPGPTWSGVGVDATMRPSRFATAITTWARAAPSWTVARYTCLAEFGS